MICPNCGKENKDSDKFCGFCGTVLLQKESKSGSKLKKKYMWTIVIAILLLCAMILAIVLESQDVKEKKYQNFIENGERYLEELEYEKAEIAFLDAIKIEPKKVKPYVQLANTYIAQDKYEDAKDILEQAEGILVQLQEKDPEKYEEEQNYKEEIEDKQQENEDNLNSNKEPKEDSYKTVDLYVDNEEERTRNNLIFSEEYNEETEEHIVSISQNGTPKVFTQKKRLGRYLITDGDRVFYSTSVDEKGIVYCTNITGGKEQVIWEKDLEEHAFFSLVGFYDEKIFYVKGEEMGLASPANLYVYDLKSKQDTQVLEDVSTIQQHNNFLYVFPVRGDSVSVTATNIQVYDVKTGKSNIISEQVCDAGQDVLEANEGYLYYLEWTELKSMYMFAPTEEVNIVCCESDGSNRQQIVEKLNISYVLSLNDKRIVYTDENREQKVLFFEN